MLRAGTTTWKFPWSSLAVRKLKRAERWDRTVLLPGDRQTIRERTTTVTMHGLRRLLPSRA